MNSFKRQFVVFIIIISEAIIPQTGNSPYNPLSINSMVVIGERIFAGGNYGVYLSENNGANWNRFNNGLTDSIVVSLAVNGNYLFAATTANGIFRSGDFGLNWTPVNNNLSHNYLLKLDTSGNKIYALTDNRIFFSGDNGENWDTINTSNVTSYPPYNWKFFTIYHGNIFLYGEFSRYPQHDEDIFRSTNNGVSWDLVTNNLYTGYPYTTIHGLLITHDTLFALKDGWSHDNDIYYTRNLGDYWNSCFTNGPVSAVLMTDSYFFAGSGTGVICSTDNGVTWDLASNGLNYAVTLFLNKGNYIFASTNEHGIFSTTDYGNQWIPCGNGLPISDIKEPSPINSTDYFLSQNFPNPFNPTTKIKYRVMSESNVKLSVYNLLGEEIIELANTVQTTGEHEVIFNSKGLSGGVYFYSLKAIPINGMKEINEVRKMILLK